MDFGATMKGRTGGLESNGPEAGNRRKFLATAAAAGAAGAGRIVRSTRTPNWCETDETLSAKRQHS
jgi:hypothetical protein